MKNKGLTDSRNHRIKGKDKPNKPNKPDEPDEPNEGNRYGSVDL